MLDRSCRPAETNREIKHELPAGNLHCLVNTEAVGGGHRHRLFQEDVLLRVQGSHRQIGMGAMRGSNRNDIY